jgi:hypothetical protein
MQKQRPPATWIEITLDRRGDEIRVSARGSRGEQTKPRPLGSAQSAAAMLAFADMVRLAAHRAKPLPPALLADAQAAERALLDDAIGPLLSRLREAAGGPLLLRLMVHDPELQAVPWEALCKPGEALGFWAGAPDILPVRGVTSSEPWLPPAVEGAVRVLAIAPRGGPSLASLSGALEARINAGEIAWLNPIEGPAARPQSLLGLLRRGPSPHVIHFLGHGGLRDGIPVLSLDDGGGDDDDDSWLPVELLAQQLQASFRGELRLVVLECCEGARPSALASAAEILARAGADAVVAHLWPVKADVARAFSTEIYRVLAGADRNAGDITVAVNEARRVILGAFGGSAEAFSPVLYLRGPDGVIFNFHGRSVAPAAKQPSRTASNLGQPSKPSDPEPRDISTPIAALVGAPTGQTTYLTTDALVQLWRRARVRDELRFNPPKDGFDDGDNTTRVFRLGPGSLDLFLGRAAEHKGHKNDLVLPYKKVSQQCLRVRVREGRTTLQRLEECRAQVMVGMHVLEPGEERPIYHGQIVSIGHVVSGYFVDGRYTQPQVSPHAIDPMTGLLGRDGIAWEIAIALRVAEPPELLLIQPKGDDVGAEMAACRAALALHAHVPSQPIARLDACVVLVLAGAEALEPLVAVAQRAAGAPVTAGHYKIGAATFDAATREAAACVEKARGALDRASALASPGAILDLNRHTPLVLDVPRFERDASALLARGGEIVLVALAERDRLDQLGPGVCDALELEVLEMLGRGVGARAMLTRPLPGIVACAGPGDIEAVARDVAASWRALGPVRGDNIEVERGICVEVVRAPEAPNLARRAVDLASGPNLRIEALPAPLALRVRAALGAAGPLEAATTFVELVRETFRFAAVALVSMLVRSSQKLPPASDAGDADEWLDPWRSRAAQAAAALANTPGRVGALVSAWIDPQGAPREALAAAARLASVLQRAIERRPIDMALLHREAPAIRAVLDDLVAELGVLRGWTLVAVERSDALDPYRDAETVSYIDYTGSFELGAPRRVTLLSNRRIGPFVYLARFAEGIVVPLEPFARRRLCPACGIEELFWAEQLITAPGRHAYRSVHRGHLLEDDVQQRDIPPSLRGPE